MYKLRAIKPNIRLEFVGMYFGPRHGMFADESPQSAFLDIINRFHEDFT